MSGLARRAAAAAASGEGVGRVRHALTGLPILALVQRLRTHPAGTAGGAALLVALMLAAAVLWPLQAEVQALQQALDRAASTAPARAPAPPPDPAQELRRLREQFPRIDAAPQALLLVHTLATAHGLQMPSGEYRMEQRADDPLARYQLTLPLQGRYESLRRFLSQLLRELPSAALDDVQIQREESGDGRLTARVRLSIYLRGA